MRTAGSGPGRPGTPCESYHFRRVHLTFSRPPCLSQGTGRASMVPGAGPSAAQREGRACEAQGRAQSKRTKLCTQRGGTSAICSEGPAPKDANLPCRVLLRPPYSTTEPASVQGGQQQAQRSTKQSTMKSQGKLDPGAIK